MRVRNYGGLFLVGVFLVALSVVSDREASAQQADVLVCGDSVGVPMLEDIQALLQASGQFTTVDVFDVTASTPTLGELQNYDAVLFFTNDQPNDRVGLGNVLANYVDAGGGVLEMPGVFSVTWGPAGLWANYITLLQQDVALQTVVSLGTIVVPGHPIMEGITTVGDGFLRSDRTSPINGAVTIAEWSDGRVLLATNETFTGRVAAINAFPLTTNVDAEGWDPAVTDTDELMVNALVWVANIRLEIDSPAAGALPVAEVNTDYSVTFTAASGQEPYSWSVTGTLPPGLTLDPDTGVLSGIPTAAGDYSFDITVTDQVPNNDTRSYTITVVEELLITAPAAGALADGALDAAYGPVNFTATGGTQPYTWSISALPAGMTFDTATGQLAGTPTAAGTHSFDITVTDINSLTDTRSYTLDVIDMLGIASPPAGALTAGYPNEAYSMTFTAIGGTPAYTWSSTGSLPPGLSFDPATGVLSGTPTALGSWTFTITVTDQVPDSDSNTYTLDIVTAPSISSPAPGALSEGTEQAPTSYGIPAVTFTVADGAPTFTWSATGLPAGLSINPATSEITGTPDPGTAGTHAITVTVTDANGKQASADYTITINAPVAITTASLPEAKELYPYTATVVGIAGTPTHSWTASFSPPLAGFTIDPSTGQISGTAQAGDAGTYNVTITYTDRYGSKATAVLPLTIKVPTGEIGSPGGCSCNAAATAPTTRANGLQGLWLFAVLVGAIVTRRRLG